MKIEAVVFDIGNVLLEWHPERVYDRVLGEARRKEFFQSVPIHEANLSIDAGKPFKETILNLAEEMPKWGDEIRMWNDLWLEMITPAIDHSVRLLRALRGNGVPVFALTNFGDETFDIAQREFDFLNEFDREYVSARLKVIKPDPAIYAHVEADSGLAPESLLFTDDRRENTEAAAARGWQVHHFTSPQGWADKLVESGLLTKDQAV